jgi:hypothetical protein
VLGEEIVPPVSQGVEEVVETQLPEEDYKSVSREDLHDTDERQVVAALKDTAKDVLVEADATSEEIQLSEEPSLVAKQQEEQLTEPFHLEELAFASVAAEAEEGQDYTSPISDYDSTPRDGLFDSELDKLPAVTRLDDVVEQEAASTDPLTSTRLSEDHLEDSGALPSVRHPVLEAESKFVTETAAPEEYIIESAVTETTLPRSAVLEKPAMSGVTELEQEQSLVTIAPEHDYDLAAGFDVADVTIPEVVAVEKELEIVTPVVFPEITSDERVTETTIEAAEYVPGEEIVPPGSLAETSGRR